ncbi:MAG TPA: hypothetical protein VLA58_11170 [Chitinophagaceae bacterium]|nr:hypothetical protein [Chitinophagaceae bacterium]
MRNIFKPVRNRFEMVVRLLTGLFLILFAYKLYRLFFIHNKLNDYLFSENLLHYEGGYIRRSFLGNLFVALPESYWRLGIMLLYSALLILLVVFIYKACNNVYALMIFLCAPFGLRMLMFDYGSLYRKEFMFYFLILAVIILYKKSKDHTRNLIIVTALSALMVMVHESFIFLGMPVIAWILYVNQAGRKRVLAYVFLCSGAFLMLSQMPSSSQIQALDQFFAARNIDWNKTRLYLTMNRTETIKFSLAHLLQGSILFYLLYFLPLVLYMFYMRMINRKMIILLAVQMILCMVLCTIAIDYGRWLSFVLISFFICLFVYGDLGELTRRIRDSAREKLIYVVVLLLMLSVFLPHHIEDYRFTASFIEYSFFEKISHSFSELMRENQ